MRTLRPRRSVLAVPGSSPKMLAKAQGLPVDEAFLDLEDAVAADAKRSARANVVAALNDGDWAGTTPAVRGNDQYTPRT
jgi:citrate lyase subunit beta/citryl-CoA lyase